MTHLFLTRHIVKHPIVGDPIYGQTEENIVRFLDKEISPEERIKLSGAS